MTAFQLRTHSALARHKDHTASQVASPLLGPTRCIAEIPQIPSLEARRLDRVARQYAFRVNDYYLDLIDWSDPADPIRRLVIPDAAELNEWGRLDASDEAANTVAHGVQHKYRDTALVLTASTCAAYCRYCFRKRLFMRHNTETARDFQPAYDYIARHEEITDVLLTGGDPLVLKTQRLAPVMRRFAGMAHIRTLRIGSKIPAFYPFRILDDPSLMKLISDVVDQGTAVYLMAHFDHPRELTEAAREAIASLQQAGAHVVNQCPLIRGVNDDPEVLADLFETMTELGAPQYYLFQGRPTSGNQAYDVPLVEGWTVFDRARRKCSGLSRRMRYSMSHATGKIEVLGVDDSHIWLRYHRARDAALESKVMVCERDDEAFWLDDLEVVS
jgi:lysine 2,3-aminomutase